MNKRKRKLCRPGFDEERRDVQGSRGEHRGVLEQRV